jgi:hypothetical protein
VLPFVGIFAVSDSSPYSQVEAILRAVPQEFDFFQSVRLLERIRPGKRRCLRS